jgi:hypothetical protein
MGGLLECLALGTEAFDMTLEMVLRVAAQAQRRKRL